MFRLPTKRPEWEARISCVSTLACVASVSVLFRESKTAQKMALVSFLSRPKPRISFLGLSLLRNSTETLATRAISTSAKKLSPSPVVIHRQLLLSNCLFLNLFYLLFQVSLFNLYEAQLHFRMAQYITDQKDKTTTTTTTRLFLLKSTERIYKKYNY